MSKSERKRKTDQPKPQRAATAPASNEGKSFGDFVKRIVRVNPKANKASQS